MSARNACVAHLCTVVQPSNGCDHDDDDDAVAVAVAATGESDETASLSIGELGRSKQLAGYLTGGWLTGGR